MPVFFSMYAPTNHSEFKSICVETFSSTSSIASCKLPICPARTKSSERTADVVLDGAVLNGGISLGGGDGGVT